MPGKNNTLIQKHLREEHRKVIKLICKANICIIPDYLNLPKPNTHRQVQSIKKGTSMKPFNILEIADDISLVTPLKN